MPVAVFIRLLIACLLAGGAGSARAAHVAWLYDIEIDVASQTDAERRRAASAALGELLKRLTGLRDIPASPAVDAALQRPGDYYTRFEFATRKVPGTTSRTVLEVYFDPPTVLALLRRAELPVWGADRPTILAWVAVQRGEERAIMAASDTGEVTAALDRRARQRGLPLSLPVMDLQDFEVSPADVWGRFWERVNGASARYAPDLLLIGRIRAGADHTRSDWQLRARADPARRGESFDDTATAAFQVEAEDPAAVVRRAVDHVAEALAQRLAVRGNLDTIRIAVYGAQTLRGYASLLDYLESREYIQRLDVTVVEPQQIELLVQSRSDRRQLGELLSVGGTLAVLPQPRSDPLAGPPALHVEWLGAK